MHNAIQRILSDFKQNTISNVHPFPIPNTELTQVFDTINTQNSEVNVVSDAVNVANNESNDEFTNFVNGIMNDDTDNDIIMDENECISNEDIPETVISNIFINHPLYNTESPYYQEALTNYIQSHHHENTNKIQHAMGPKQIDSTKIFIPIETAEVTITAPFHSTIISMIDKGSDIDAVGPEMVWL